MSDRFLLDTSAILALTDREEGWEVVASLLHEAVAGQCQLHGATLVHKDPEIEALGAELEQRTLPFKRKQR